MNVDSGCDEVLAELFVSTVHLAKTAHELNQRNARSITAVRRELADLINVPPPAISASAGASAAACVAKQTEDGGGDDEDEEEGG